MVRGAAGRAGVGRARSSRNALAIRRALVGSGAGLTKKSGRAGAAEAVFRAENGTKPARALSADCARNPLGLPAALFVSACIWRRPSPSPRDTYGEEPAGTPKRSSQRPPRPRRALLARRVGRWPIGVSGCAVSGGCRCARAGETHAFPVPARPGGGEASGQGCHGGRLPTLQGRMPAAAPPCTACAQPGSSPRGRFAQRLQPVNRRPPPTAPARYSPANRPKCRSGSGARSGRHGRRPGGRRRRRRGRRWLRSSGRVH